MDNFPRVHLGEKVVHSMTEENAIRDMLKARNSFIAGNGGNAKQKTIRIPVYTVEGLDVDGVEIATTIDYGTPVTIDLDYPMVGECYPVRVTKSTDSFWCVLNDTIKSGAIGNATISGIAKITTTGTISNYVKPDNGAFTFSSSGRGEVLYSDRTNTIILLGGGGGSAVSYDSYFKIVDISTTEFPARIKIVDGGSYNETTGTSGDSTAKVNSTIYSVDPISFDVTVSGTIFALEYTAAIEADGEILAQDATMEIVALSELPDDTSENVYYQIGRVYLDDDNNISITQDHVVGVAQMYWYALCEDA